LTICSKPEELHERVFHSLLLSEHSSLSEPQSCIFLGSFWRPLWRSALGSCLVCLNVALTRPCYSR